MLGFKSLSVDCISKRSHISYISNSNFSSCLMTNMHRGEAWDSNRRPADKIHLCLLQLSLLWDTCSLNSCHPVCPGISWLGNASFAPSVLGKPRQLATQENVWVPYLNWQSYRHLQGLICKREENCSRWHGESSSFLRLSSCSTPITGEFPGSPVVKGLNVVTVGGASSSPGQRTSACFRHGQKKRANSNHWDVKGGRIMEKEVYGF